MRRDWPLKSSELFRAEEASLARPDGPFPASESIIACGPETSYLRLFHRLRARLVANSTDYVLRQSPLRIITILLCRLLLWWAVLAIILPVIPFLRTKIIHLTA